MKEDMPNIDVSGIDSLRTLKEEQDVIKDRLQKMDEMKDKVTEAVYQKVRGEYTGKLDELAGEAEPLKSKIREQYAVLKQAMDELETEMSRLSLEKEELEFRHTLGEYPDKHFKQELKKWEERSLGIQAELDGSQEMKTLFLSVFDSSEDLEALPMAEDASSTIPSGDAGVTELAVEEEQAQEPELEALNMAGPESDLHDDGEFLTDDGSEDLLDEADVLDDSVSADVLVDDDSASVLEEDDLAAELSGEADDLSADFGEMTDTDLSADFGELEHDLEDGNNGTLPEDETTAGLSPPPIPGPAIDTQPVQKMQPPPPPTPDRDATILAEQIPLIDEGDEDPDGTMIISNPKIISLNNNTEGQVIVLGMGTTSIGRSPDNDIHIPEDRISRKHSQIAFGPGGYSIYDLNSENGTYVNGNRVREHFLSDGDIVMIGTYKFLYRDR